MNLGPTSINERLADAGKKSPSVWHKFLVLEKNGVELYSVKILCSPEYAALIKDISEEGVSLRIERETTSYEEI